MQSPPHFDGAGGGGVATKRKAASNITSDSYPNSVSLKCRPKEHFLEVDSFPILFNHGSFEKPDPFPLGL